MEIKEKTGIKKILIEEVFLGEVFKHRDQYYINCKMASHSFIQCVELRSGNLIDFDRGTKVELVEGEFVCQ